MQKSLYTECDFLENCQNDDVFLIIFFKFNDVYFVHKGGFCYEKKVKMKKAISLGIVDVMALGASGLTNEKLTLAKSTESSAETSQNMIEDEEIDNEDEEKNTQNDTYENNLEDEIIKLPGNIEIEDGKIIIPQESEIITPGGNITVPGGTEVDMDGSMTIPAGEEVRLPGGTVIKNQAMKTKA